MARASTKQIDARVFVSTARARKVLTREFVQLDIEMLEDLVQAPGEVGFQLSQRRRRSQLVEAGLYYTACTLVCM